MIQRIQSIFLLLAALSMAALFLLPVAQSDKLTGSFSDGVYNTQDSMIYLGATIVTIILAILAIFLYNNRKTQLWAVMGFAVCCGFIIGYLGMTIFVSLKDLNPTLSFGVGAPILALIFSSLAYRNISKDDKLVKSMDRLR